MEERYLQTYDTEKKKTDSKERYFIYTRETKGSKSVKDFDHQNFSNQF